MKTIKLISNEDASLVPNTMSSLAPNKEERISMVQTRDRIKLRLLQEHLLHLSASAPCLTPSHASPGNMTSFTLVSSILS